MSVTLARLPIGSEEEAVARLAYRRLLQFDKRVRELSTEWEVASLAGDPDVYGHRDWYLIDRVTTLDTQVASVISELGRTVPRFEPYRPRLTKALQRLQDGERQWLSGEGCDSYDTIWWQLREDLLLALGIAESGQRQP